MTVHAHRSRNAATRGVQEYDPIISGGGSLSAKSEIPELARALAEWTGNVDSDELERAIIGGCIYADAIVLSDDIIDYSASDDGPWARDVPRTGAYFLDSAMIWAQIFPPSSAFWTALRRYHREYLGAMHLEGEIGAGKRTWESCDEALCLHIVRGKNGPVRAIAAFVAALAHRPEALEDLETLTLGYYAANQMLDDVKDWREDIRDGNISLVLRRASPRRPSSSDLQSIGVRLYGGGHVDYVLNLACTQLADLLALARRLGAARYAGLLERRLTQFTTLAAQLRTDIVAQSKTTNR